MRRTTRQSGFTLIEIAIVLVIIGLLLGGILKGQELITSARVRNLISQQDGIKAAFYGFQDRYRALPGDYGQATSNLSGGTATANGNGDGTILQPTGGENEPKLAWDHLTRAGFLNGNYVYDTTAKDGPSPKNPYGQDVQLIYDGAYGSASSPLRHNIKTGAQVPVEILAEIDRKTDDGTPVSGSFQFSTYGSAASTCITAAAPFTWNLTATPSSPNCGGATLL